MSLETRSDESLVQEYINGKNEAFDELVRRYTAMLYAFVYARLNDQGEADDIVQHVFIKAWKALMRPSWLGGSFDSKKGTFKTWIYSIAKNTILDFFKKKREIPFCSFDTENGENILKETVADAQNFFDTFARRDEASQIYTQAIFSLDSKQKEVIILRYNEGLTFKEIGERLSEPLDTVKSRHRRAVALLRVCAVGKGFFMGARAPENLS